MPFRLGEVHLLNVTSDQLHSQQVKAKCYGNPTGLSIFKFAIFADTVHQLTPAQPSGGHHNRTCAYNTSVVCATINVTSGIEIQVNQNLLSSRGISAQHPVIYSVYLSTHRWNVHSNKGNVQLKSHDTVLR